MATKYRYTINGCNIDFSPFDDQYNCDLQGCIGLYYNDYLTPQVVYLEIKIVEANNYLG